MAQRQPLDTLSRPIGVLRLSLTARCNLACPYCLPDGEEPPELLIRSWLRCSKPYSPCAVKA
jgi:cyclic pyranopterin phosphate synthase